MHKPIIGVTMGDPAGIGPEISVKALTDPEVYKFSRPIIIGDQKVLSYAIKISRLPGVTLHPIRSVDEARFEKNRIEVLDLNNVDMARLKLGEVSASAGKASIEYLEKAIGLAKAKKIDALTTGPINKEAIHKAGIKFPGHTEILAKRTNTKNYAMLFVSDKLWVILVTTHLALRDVPKAINKKKVLSTIKLAYDTLRKIKGPKVRLAVAGLNPHAGEAGLFGREEIKHIAPAVREAQKAGINVVGPLSPDAVFNLAAAGAYDLVVAMYHDQGLIPLKLLAFNRSVNVTVGLPIVRTSVDHGTGFDIAGRGYANPGSLIQAIKVAVHFANARHA